MFYFAYGSNMVTDHMRRICGRRCFPLGAALLEGYEIGLDKRGYANIRPCPEEKVFGALYELDQQALDALDSFEGYPDVFNRVTVEVTDSAGQSCQAWVYLEPDDQFGGNFPRQEYFSRVLVGARQHHLPQFWTDRIRRLAGLPPEHPAPEH